MPRIPPPAQIRGPNCCTTKPTPSVTKHANALKAIGTDTLSCINVGTIALPVKPEPNTHGAAGTTTNINRGKRAEGTEQSAHHEPFTRKCALCLVSRTTDNNGNNATVNTRWIPYANCPGQGAHCASTPETRAPKAKPAVNDIAARFAPEAPDDNSFNQLPPAVITIPTAAPAKKRPPAINNSTCSPRAINTDATIATTGAGNITGLRPYLSDKGPLSSNATTTPKAYIANMESTNNALKSPRWR